MFLDINISSHTSIINADLIASISFVEDIYCQQKLISRITIYVNSPHMAPVIFDFEDKGLAGDVYIAFQNALGGFGTTRLGKDYKDYVMTIETS